MVADALLWQVDYEKTQCLLAMSIETSCFNIVMKVSIEQHMRGKAKRRISFCLLLLVVVNLSHKV
jgi:hypothetical protein